MKTTAWVPTGPDDAPLGVIDLAGGRASINQRKLRRHGFAGWQATTTAALLTSWDLTPKPGVFLDVGANAGIYSLLCSLLWPSIRAIAFEPSATTVAAGQRWSRANGTPVRFEQVGVSDTDGHLYLSSRSDASNSMEPGFREPSGTLDIEVVRLDTYVEREDIVPTVVKVDVEQHEPAVVRGATATLALHRPVIVMEVLRTEASRQAHRQMCDLGYEPYDLGARDRVYWPDALPPNWDTRFGGWLRAVRRCEPRHGLTPPESVAARLRRAAGRHPRWSP